MKTSFPILLLLLCSCQQPGSPEKPAPKPTPYPLTGKIERFHPALDSLVPSGAVIEILADGFAWTEGPLWITPGDYLLFTDIPSNRVLRWKEGEGATPYLSPAGYTGQDQKGGEPGANGLLLDAQGRLVLCQHGDRRVARMNAPLDRPQAQFETLAGQWQGKRFNSPNDAVFDRQGRLYFTDPPYGLEKQTADPAKEIPFQGVYRRDPDGRVTLLIDSMSRPNGIALSPDEKTLYVANSDTEHAVWMAYGLRPDGSLAPGRVFYDATVDISSALPGPPDGLKVDAQGNLWASGPGGIYIFKADGRLLGRINTGQKTSNCGFGKDGKNLYITGSSQVLRIRDKPMNNSENNPRWRKRLHDIIYESNTLAGRVFDTALLIAIMASILVVMLDSVESFRERYHDEFIILEWAFTILFTIEYILRLISIRRPMRYVLSPLGVVDLLALIPSYLSVLFAGAQSLLVLRSLRLLRIFRIFKLAHFMTEMRFLVGAITASLRKISIFMLTILTLVVILGSIMYLVEGPENGFTSIPESIYWAIVTITTVGYGDISPVTPLGRALASFVMLIGYAIIAVPTGIVTTELMIASRAKGHNHEVCPNCGREGHDEDARYCKFCGTWL